MTLDDIARVQFDFVASAKRALAAGFQWLELHFAHGYLAQSFFSPVANQRTDQYGGSAENRGRFLLETLAAVRAVWPEHLPLTARFGVVEYDGSDDSFYPEAAQLVRQMHDDGLDLIDASIGFSTLNSKAPWGPGFFVPVAARLKHDVRMPVAASWCIDDPHMAESAIAEGSMGCRGIAGMERVLRSSGVMTTEPSIAAIEGSLDVALIQKDERTTCRFQPRRNLPQVVGSAGSCTAPTTPC